MESTQNSTTTHNHTESTTQKKKKIAQTYHQQQFTGHYHHPILLKKSQNQHKNQKKKKKWRDESIPFIQPKSHRINPTPPPPIITWNPQPGKKKSAHTQTYMQSWLVDLIGEAELLADLKGNGLGGEKRRKREREHDREKKRDRGCVWFV